MTQPIAWQKSSFSMEEGECLELAAIHGSIKLRESDDPDEVVTTTPRKLAVFIAGLKSGEFDLR
jgi:hypothetical protein